jgi:transposase
MAQAKHRPADGPPNMREQSVGHLIAFRLNDACRHQALIDVSGYPNDTPVPWFQSKINAASAASTNRSFECSTPDRNRHREP